jgi:hypothetical protein
MIAFAVVDAPEEAHQWKKMSWVRNVERRMGCCRAVVYLCQNPKRVKAEQNYNPQVHKKALMKEVLDE